MEAAASFRTRLVPDGLDQDQIDPVGFVASFKMILS
jgi:hypothetical protein